MNCSKLNDVAADGVIRTATPADFELLMLLYRQLQPADPILTDGTDQNTYTKILESPHLHLLVMEYQDSLIATTYLNIIPNITRSASPYAVIENVVTSADFRGQGVGRRLMQQTLAVAWQQGCYKAMLQTGSKTSATHAFYRACGFRDDDKTGYVARP